MATNFIEEELIIPKATVCGVVQASESLRQIEYYERAKLG